AIRAGERDGHGAEPEGDAARAALLQANRPDAAERTRRIVEAEAARSDLLERPRGDRDAVDVVVVAEGDRDRLRRRIDPGRHAAEVHRELEDALADLPADARHALGTVPDRRRPGALLDRLRDGRVAALLIAARHGAAAVDALRVAEVRAPPARRVLEHAGVVEGALGRVELGV